MGLGGGVGCVACRSRSHLDLDLASVKLCSISLAVVSPSRSLWSRSPPSRCPGRLGLSDLALHHLAHSWISLLSLAVVVAVFFRVVVMGCVWLIWVMVGWFEWWLVDFGMVLWIWDLGWCRWVWDLWLCRSLWLSFVFFKGDVSGCGFIPVVAGRCCYYWWPLLWQWWMCHCCWWWWYGGDNILF